MASVDEAAGRTLAPATLERAKPALPDATPAVGGVHPDRLSPLRRYARQRRTLALADLTALVFAYAVVWFAAPPAAYAWVWLTRQLWTAGRTGRVALLLVGGLVALGIAAISDTALCMADRCVYAQPLAVGLNPQRQELADVLRKYTKPDHRILWEDRAVNPVGAANARYSSSTASGESGSRERIAWRSVTGNPNGPSVVARVSGWIVMVDLSQNGH